MTAISRARVSLALSLRHAAHIVAGLAHGHLSGAARHGKAAALYGAVAMLLASSIRARLMAAEAIIDDEPEPDDLTPPSPPAAS